MLCMHIRNYKLVKNSCSLLIENALFSLTLALLNLKDVFFFFNIIDRKVNFSCKEKQLSDKNKLKKCEVNAKV